MVVEQGLSHDLLQSYPFLLFTLHGWQVVTQEMICRLGCRGRWRDQMVGAERGLVYTLTSLGPSELGGGQEGSFADRIISWMSQNILFPTLVNSPCPFLLVTLGFESFLATQLCWWRRGCQTWYHRRSLTFLRSPSYWMTSNLEHCY